MRKVVNNCVFFIGSNVTANSLHPGIIMTDLQRNYNLTNPYYIGYWVFCAIDGLMFKTIVQGAQTTIHCAVAEELEGVTGKYFR